VVLLLLLLRVYYCAWWLRFIMIGMDGWFNLSPFLPRGIYLHIIIGPLLL